MDNFVTRMKQAVQHIQKARDIMARGPLEYYLAKLVEHSEALLTRFAPLQVGQRAVIVGEIKCKNAWSGREKTLAKGAVGVVREVEYSDGVFWISWVPDNDWWKDRNGDWQLCELRGIFCLKATDLVPFDDEVKGTT